MKTIFFSTSDRMIPIVEELNKLTELKLCITKTDVKVGRKMEIKENPVKLWCIENNIPYIQIDNLKDKNLELVVEKIKEIQPDLGIVVDFAFMIKDPILELFNTTNKEQNKNSIKDVTINRNLVNIHYSLLPKYRGASPIQFAILNGDKETGITYQVLDKEMDKGNILYQIKYQLKGNETYLELFEQLLSLNINSLSKFIELYKSNELENITQGENEATYTYSKTNPKSTLVYKEDAYTDLKEPSEVIERKIRGFNPRPILWTHLKFIEEYTGLKIKDESKKDLTVKIYDGKLNPDTNKVEFTKIQLEGKNAMDWNSFVNGYFIK